LHVDASAPAPTRQQETRSACGSVGPGLQDPARREEDALEARSRRRQGRPRDAHQGRPRALDGDTDYGGPAQQGHHECLRRRRDRRAGTEPL
jgi:hypothetical protein